MSWIGQNTLPRMRRLWLRRSSRKIRRKHWAHGWLFGELQTIADVSLPQETLWRLASIGADCSIEDDEISSLLET